MDRDFLIPESLVQAIARYLSQRPWVEVHEAMAALEKLQPTEQPPKPSD